MIHIVVYKYDTLAVMVTIIEEMSKFLVELSKAVTFASNNMPYYKTTDLEEMNKINKL